MFYFPQAVRLAGRILQGYVTALAALPGVPFWLFSIMLTSALGQDLIWSMPWLDINYFRRGSAFNNRQGGSLPRGMTFQFANAERHESRWCERPYP
jgi:hypothetical protein